MRCLPRHCGPAFALATLAIAATLAGPLAASPGAGSTVTEPPARDPLGLRRGAITKNTRLIAGRFLVKPTGVLKDDDALVAALSADLQQPVRVVRHLVLGWVQVETEDALSEDETLVLVERAKKTAGIEKSAAEWVWRAFATTPNDPFFPNMWHLDMIGARNAWDITQGNTDNRVGVVDTGTFFGHEDLGAKSGAQFDFISDGQSANDGGGRDSDATDAGDDCGEGNSFHGTHVAGTILANGNNNIGITGVNWNAKLVTGRALGRCGGTTVDIDEAVAWMAGFQVNPAPVLAAADRPRVINLSLGATGAPCDSFTNDVWAAVTGRGHLLVIASGNDAAPVASPANCPDSIAVAAYGPRNGGQLASYSNFGNEIDIVGPGGDQAFGVFEEGVLSSVHPSISPFQGSIPYTFYQGTSMAAPHVAGVLSLMLDVNPGLSKDAAVGIMQSTGQSCTNCQGKIAVRADFAVAEAAGTEISTQPGDSCEGTLFCSSGQTCVGVGDETLCLQDCSTDNDCSGSETCTTLQSGGGVCFDDGSTGEGEGEGEGEDIGECDVRRGNMDCPVGEGCVERDGLGECVRGRDGDGANGSLCERDSDCGSGLCDLGVCTVTCDDVDCREGYRCDEDAVPGGLCVAQSCVDDPSICGDVFACSYSSDSRYVCAVGPSNYLGVCGSAPKATAPVAGLLLGLLALGLRRRRR